MGVNLTFISNIPACRCIMSVCLSVCVRSFARARESLWIKNLRLLLTVMCITLHRNTHTRTHTHTQSYMHHIWIHIHSLTSYRTTQLVYKHIVYYYYTIMLYSGYAWMACLLPMANGNNGLALAQQYDICSAIDNSWKVRKSFGLILDAWCAFQHVKFFTGASN